MTYELEFDVLIVGAGGCGLTTALALYEQNPDCSLAILDAAERACGNTVLSSGSIPAAGTRFQKEAGIQDSAQRFQEDLLAVSGAHEAMPLVKALTEVSAELVEWLVDYGRIQLTLIQDYKHIGHQVHRLHAPVSRRGADLVSQLLAACEARGIPIAWDSRVQKLLTDSQGKLTGLSYQTPDKATYQVGARQIVLACNGFGANKELLARYAPEVSDIAYGGGMESHGDALKWGLSLGAEVANIGAYQAHASLADPHGSLLTWTVIEKGGIIVDSTGARIGNESIGYSAFAALEAQKGGPFWVIADTTITKATADGQEEYAELVAHGGVQTGPAEQLANTYGFDLSTFKSTLEEVRNCAQEATADNFGRTNWGMGPLKNPLTATRIQPALFHTQGGLKTDPDGRVLDTNNQPIAGLWAGGGAAAGISGARGGNGYMSGNGLLAALGMGYRIGKALGSIKY